MSRLLHAAARGARIQALAQDMWFGVPYVRSKDERRALRIHPSDEAKQYGPVSSALREMAEINKVPKTVYGRMAWGAYVHEALTGETRNYDVVILLLLLAEFLADEGL